jgi:hypothetical protein
VRPPRIEVVNHELHYEVLSPLLLVVTLENEPTRSGVEDRDISIQNLLETQRLVETLGQIEVPCGEERSSQFGSSRDARHLVTSVSQTDSLRDVGVYTGVAAHRGQPPAGDRARTWRPSRGQLRFGCGVQAERLR